MLRQASRRKQHDIDPKILEYIVRLGRATRDPGAVGRADLKELLLLGISPRSYQHLLALCRVTAFLAGRAYAMPEDVKEIFADAGALAAAIKALPIVLAAPRPVDEAISSAGGVALEALDDALMARVRPGLFCAGEMLDWEAPTGGYLLQASFASGVIAAQGLLTWRKG